MNDKVKKDQMDWEQLMAKESGNILYDEFDEGIRFIIMRGPVSLCAYIGIPIAHPLAGHNYDDLPVCAHGGLTYSSEGKGAWPEGYYWYGWDYAHSGDYCFYYDREPLVGRYDHSTDQKWLVEDVKEDSWSTLYDFKKLLRLTEKTKSNIK